jgi:hypothetical protein
VARDCPKCGLINPPSAQRCDCGYDFAAKRVLSTYLSEKDLKRGQEEGEEKGVGIALRIMLRLAKLLGG